jgi:hypothetical protein
VSALVRRFVEPASSKNLLGAVRGARFARRETSGLVAHDLSLAKACFFVAQGIGNRNGEGRLHLGHLGAPRSEGHVAVPTFFSVALEAPCALSGIGRFSANATFADDESDARATKVGFSETRANA